METSLSSEAGFRPTVAWSNVSTGQTDLSRLTSGFCFLAKYICSNEPHLFPLIHLMLPSCWDGMKKANTQTFVKTAFQNIFHSNSKKQKLPLTADSDNFILFLWEKTAPENSLIRLLIHLQQASYLIICKIYPDQTFWKSNTYWKWTFTQSHLFSVGGHGLVEPLNKKPGCHCRWLAPHWCHQLVYF